MIHITSKWIYVSNKLMYELVRFSGLYNKNSKWRIYCRRLILFYKLCESEVLQRFVQNHILKTLPCTIHSQVSNYVKWWLFIKTQRFLCKFHVKLKLTWKISRYPIARLLRVSVMAMQCVRVNAKSPASVLLDLEWICVNLLR